MSSRSTLARRRKAASSQFGLTERLFSSPGDRSMALAIERGLEQVEAGLAGQVAFADSIADVTTRYLLDAGGKRVRPVLTLLTAQLGDGVTDKVITAAQAIEITHLGSLYHDDVMDEAEQRRGVPSAQTVWGNSVAILAGDLLFARASLLIADLDSSAVATQASTFERLVLGQLHETVGPQPGDDPVEHYISVLQDKTGALIAAAAEWGIAFSGADPSYREPVRQFGERVGVAFQLVDDVIDLSAEPGDTGKVPGTDLLQHVPTLPLLYLRRSAQTNAADADLVRRIDDTVERIEAGTESADALDGLVAEIRVNDATQQTATEARRWADSAIAALDPIPEGRVKRALVRFAQLMVDRTN
jgi:heptaprenyl diphosphate synthase